MSHQSPLPFDGEGGDVWDALTNIFADMDSQGGVGARREALQETLASLRGLLDMHLQLRKKAVELTAKAHGGGARARRRPRASRGARRPQPQPLRTPPSA